jgi:hypothetical protein
MDLAWLKTSKPGKLSELTLVAEIKKELKAYGTHYHLYIDSVLFLIQIFSNHMTPFFQKNAINRLEKKLGLPIALNALIAP